MKRIFVGIKISEKLRSETAAWKSKYENLPVRWIAGGDLHITLVAPWEADDDEIEKIKDDLANTNFVQPFDIEFTKIIYGPDSGDPRLIWAEGEAPKEIIGLSEKLGAALDRKNIRPFLLHLTLARFRPENFSSFPVKNLNDIISWKERVKKLQLFESVLLPEGAKYDILEEFRLK